MGDIHRRQDGLDAVDLHCVRAHGREAEGLSRQGGSSAPAWHVGLSEFV